MKAGMVANWSSLELLQIKREELEEMVEPEPLWSKRCGSESAMVIPVLTFVHRKS